MLMLILFLVVGGTMVYLAQNNLVAVTLHLGAYVFPSIPLFYIIIGSLLAGLSLAYLIYFINSVFMAISMQSKDHKISEGIGWSNRSDF